MGNIPEALTYLQRSTARPGALRWIAPEQIESEETFSRTIKSDIYSFGCVALQGGLLDTDTRSVLIVLQVLSGKQPWSEVRQDAAVVLRLAKGHKPDRPESATLRDSHWNLIQQCWSAIEERPPAEMIVLFVQQLLSHSPQSHPLRNLVLSWPSQSDSLVDEASSPPSQFEPPMEDLSTRVNQVASNEDDQTMYVVMIISVRYTHPADAHNI